MSKTDNFNKEYPADLTSASDLLDEKMLNGIEYSELKHVEKYVLKTRNRKKKNTKFNMNINKNLKKRLEKFEIELMHNSLSETTQFFIRRGIKDFLNNDKTSDIAFEMYISAMFTMLDIAHTERADQAMVAAMTEAIKNAEKGFEIVYKEKFG